MAEISEKQARRVCEVFGINPDKIAWDVRAVLASALVPSAGDTAALFNSGAPAWRIVQRAAAEAEEKKP